MVREDAFERMHRWTLTRILLICQEPANGNIYADATGGNLARLVVVPVLAFAENVDLFYLDTRGNYVKVRWSSLGLELALSAVNQYK